MPEPVGGDAELDRNEGIARIDERHLRDNPGEHVGADDPWQEFIEGDPLVVPAYQGLCRFKSFLIAERWISRDAAIAIRRYTTRE
jgi:hypothetical protein